MFQSFFSLRLQQLPLPGGGSSGCLSPPPLPHAHNPCSEPRQPCKGQGGQPVLPRLVPHSRPMKPHFRFLPCFLLVMCSSQRYIQLYPHCWAVQPGTQYKEVNWREIKVTGASLRKVALESDLELCANPTSPLTGCASPWTGPHVLLALLLPHTPSPVHTHLHCMLPASPSAPGTTPLSCPHLQLPHPD